MPINDIEKQARYIEGWRTSATRISIQPMNLDSISMVQERKGKRKICYMKNINQDKERLMIEQDSSDPRGFIVWASVSSCRKIAFRFVQSSAKFDSNDFINKILKAFLLHDFRRVFPDTERKKMIYHWDSAPSQVSKKTIVFCNWSEIKHVNLMNGCWTFPMLLQWSTRSELTWNNDWTRRRSMILLDWKQNFCISDRRSIKDHWPSLRTTTQISISQMKNSWLSDRTSLESLTLFCLLLESRKISENRWITLYIWSKVIHS
jgi:hypothetical protein